VESKELIIELIKLDGYYHKKWDKMEGILDSDYMADVLFPDSIRGAGDVKNIETLVMDFIGIPKDDFNDETGEGYCRDCISDDYWDLRDKGEYEKAYKILVDEAREQNGGS